MRAMRKLPVVQLDVFTHLPLEGNALAVVDAAGLHVDHMQALARETNLSETAFIFRRDNATERAKGIRTRIFTVEEELPFAGHPTLGSAFALRDECETLKLNVPKVFHLDLNVGVVPVTFEDQGPDGAVFGEMTQKDPTFGPLHDAAELADAIGLPREVIDPSLPIETVSTGLPFTIVPLRSLAVSRALAFDQPKARAYLERKGGRFFYFVTREVVDPKAALHARMLFYGGEDPATGSAAGCTTAWAVRHGVVKPEERFLIEQGLEMKRPSRIWARAAKGADGTVTNVRIGGSAVVVMKGNFVIE
jgi:trans-2,3-dihydro-3-hydroxyanthranilate isomerase